MLHVLVQPMCNMPQMLMQALQIINGQYLAAVVSLGHQQTQIFL